MATQSDHRRRRIILFPLPFQGHLNPILQLANLLHSKGFQITILHTNFNAPKPSNYPHYTFRYILDNDPQDHRISTLPTQGMGTFNRLFVFNEHGSDELRQALQELILTSSQQDEHVPCIITDALWHFAQSVADSVNLPRLVLRTSSLFCFLTYANFPVFDDLGYLNLAEKDKTRKFFDELDHLNRIDLDQLQALNQQIPEFPVLKVKDIVQTGFKSSKDPIGMMLRNMVKQTKASSGVVWNSLKELEQSEFETVVREISGPSFLIPFPKYPTASSSSLLEQDRSFFPWLDEQPSNSVLYVSFGSILEVDERDFMEIANGLVDSDQSFIWVVRSEHVKGLSEGFLGERGRIVQWVPQQEVLGHEAIGAHWTHNGWNSTFESVCEGVPMICSPFMGDQPLNARYMSDVAKVGVCLENGWDRKEIASAIRRVMVDEEGEYIRENARVLKQKVDVALIKGGSAYESVESLVAYISSL